MEYVEKGRLDGYCDVPDEPGREPKLGMCVIDGDDVRALNSQLHEALHAIGVPDRYLHDEDGNEATTSLARFIWRMGWRRVERRRG